MADRLFTEALSFKDISEHEFETVYPPERMGNAANIAYGGYALATAAKGAYRTVPSGYHLYSMMGNFLGPAMTDRPLGCSVRIIRQTRTFATRQVEISQKQDNGTKRPCLIALCDFQIDEPALMTYSAPPKMKYTPLEKLGDTLGQLKVKLVKDGTIPQAHADLHTQNFAPMLRFFESHHAPEGIFGQNLTGMLKNLITTQEHLPLTSRTTAEYLRARNAASWKEEDHVAALVFHMDAAVAFAPLSFNHMYLDDSAACSTLDFALRVFRNGVRMDEWGLKELSTSVGAVGRTFSEARFWDGQGNCVASMTQQSILRPRKKAVL